MDITKQNTLPPGFDRKFEAGIYLLSQVVAAAFEVFPRSAGLYAGTFAPKTLAALRAGQAHLMHSANGERAIAVSLDGKIEANGIIVGSSKFDALHACFATASFVTGQYFLARIDAKLNAILVDVKNILWQLDSAERAKLNQASGYLQLLIAAVRQGRRVEQDEVEIRTHRADCLLIAERNILVLEDRMMPSASRQPLGPKERIVEGWNTVAGWAGDKASEWIPSAREEELLTEAKDFANEMIRGLVALRVSLCFEAILEPIEARSPAGMQVISLKDRFSFVRGIFQAQFNEKKLVALRDKRYFQAQEKRQRFEQELNSLLEPVKRHYEILEELEAQWKHRAAGVPEVTYVEVDEAGQPMQFSCRICEPLLAHRAHAVDEGPIACDALPGNPRLAWNAWQFGGFVASCKNGPTGAGQPPRSSIGVPVRCVSGGLCTIFGAVFSGCFDGCSLPTFLLLAASHCNVPSAPIYI